MLCLTGARVFDGENFLNNKSVYISNGKIKDISSKKNLKNYFEININGNIVCPGFIDIQLNGGGGIFFNNDLTINGLKKIRDAHLFFGTTSFLPTLITDSKSKIVSAIKVIEESLNKELPGVLGIHFEGPYINKQKKGIHPKNYIRLPTNQEVSKMFKLKSGIKLVTLAPDVIEKDIIEQFIQNDYIVFAGHTNATFTQMMNAFSDGVKGITHLFNACSQIGSRETGVVGASLLHDDSWCGIIADGHHVSFNTLKLAFKTKSTQKFILVSDAMSPVGTKLNTFFIGKNKIFVNEGKCVDANGTLAGSAITIYDALLNIYQNKLVSLEEAFQMSSTNAAQCLGIDGPHEKFKKGRILPGFDADLVILKNNSLKIMSVIQGGLTQSF